MGKALKQVACHLHETRKKCKRKKRAREGGREEGYLGKYCSNDLKCGFLLLAQNLR